MMSLLKLVVYYLSPFCFICEITLLKYLKNVEIVVLSTGLSIIHL